MRSISIIISASIQGLAKGVADDRVAGRDTNRTAASGLEESMTDQLDSGLMSLLFEICEAWRNQIQKMRSPFQGQWLNETIVIKHSSLKDPMYLNSFDFQTLVEEELIRASEKTTSILGIRQSFVPTAKAMSIHRRDPELDRTQLVAEEELILTRLNKAWEASGETFRIQIPAGNHVFTVEQSGLENGRLSIPWVHFGALERLGYLTDRWTSGNPRFGAISITAAGRDWYRKRLPESLDARVKVGDMKSDSAPPKVFLSHASADKDRFVVPFAHRLLENGIDAWLDKWEMLPGDSLIAKIFDEGLDDADAVIIVLSNESVQSRWVQQELDVAAVKRIQNRMPIIPIVIDECEIPKVLTSTVWERINDLSSYDQSFDRIVASILGRSIKPPLGRLPTYATSSTPTIAGLSAIDVQVLQVIGEIFLASEFGNLRTEQILQSTGPIGILDDEVLESIEILEGEGFIKNLGVYTPIDVFQLEYIGIWKYASTSIDGFGDKLQAIASVIVNEIADNEDTISQHLSLQPPFVAFALEYFKRNSMLKLDAPLGMPLAVVTTTAKLKRFARSRET